MLSVRGCAVRLQCKRLLCVAAVCLLPVCCCAADVFTGTLKTVHGKVFVRRLDQVLPGVAGFRLNVKDVVETGSDGSAGVILHDGTRLSMGPDSALTVEDFVFNQGAGELNLFIRVMKGVVAYASGKIAQLSPKSVKVETPVATVGLRGTKFAVALNSPSGTAK